MADFLLDLEICNIPITPTDCALAGVREYTRDDYLSTLEQIHNGIDPAALFPVIDITFTGPYTTLTLSTGSSIFTSAACFNISQSGNVTAGESSPIEYDCGLDEEGNPIPAIIGWTQYLSFSFSYNFTNVYTDYSDWGDITKVWVPYAINLEATAQEQGPCPWMGSDYTITTNYIGQQTNPPSSDCGDISEISTTYAIGPTSVVAFKDPSGVDVVINFS